MPAGLGAQLETTENYVRSGHEEGAKIVLGGKARTNVPGAASTTSDDLHEVDHSMTIAQEYIFGLCSRLSVLERRRGVLIANDSIYGRASAVGRDYDRCLETG